MSFKPRLIDSLSEFTAITKFSLTPLAKDASFQDERHGLRIRDQAPAVSGASFRDALIPDSENMTEALKLITR
jgi:hypothetical protein